MHELLPSLFEKTALWFFDPMPILIVLEDGIKCTYLVPENCQ
jgi:hypothetical protein